MPSDLADFLARHTALVEESAVWGGGQFPLRITSYLGTEHPPREYITSIRSLVVRDRSVLVMWDRDGIQAILPGGRRHSEETFETTLRREILEETGWTLTELSLLGFMHLHHLNPGPPGYPYPHPDFVWLIYRAQADRWMPESKLTGDYVVEATFCPVDEVRALPLSRSEQLYLDAALMVC
jgi:8-oxo-dGTP pyrophosphatase MutT (NUDIX family)